MLFGDDPMGSSLSVRPPPQEGAARPRNVFASLYKDALRKRQQQQQRCAPVPEGPEEPKAEPPKAEPPAPRRRSGGSLPRPGITAFGTTRRLDALAVARGPANVPVVPPAPNYGRVLNFAAEEARAARRQIPRPAPRSMSATIPVASTRIVSLAAPRRHAKSPEMRRRDEGPTLRRFTFSK